MLERDMEAKKFARSLLTKQLVVWEMYSVFSMMLHCWMLRLVSQWEITTFQNFKSIYKRLKMVMSLYQKHFSGYCWPVISQLNKNSKVYKKNGDKEVLLMKTHKNSSFHFQRMLIQWQCYPKLSYTYKRIQSLLIDIQQVKYLNHNIGNTFMKILWIC